MEEERAEHYILEQANQSKTLGKLAEALAKAQGEMEGAKTDSENPFFKSRYADLASVWDACRKPLSSNGLSVVQTTNNENGKVVIITTLLHSSGEWIRGKLAVKPVKDDPQAMGSAITYGRRYSLAAIAGISPEDDDAEGAMERDKNKDKPPLKEPRPKASESTDFPATDKQKRMVWAKLKKVYGDDEKARGFCIESTNKASSKDWTNADVQKILNQLDAMPEYKDEEKGSVPTVLPPQQEKDLILDMLRSLATEPEHVDAMCIEGIGKKAGDEWTAEDVERMRGYIGVFEKTKEAGY